MLGARLIVLALAPAIQEPSNTAGQPLPSMSFFEGLPSDVRCPKPETKLRYEGFGCRAADVFFFEG